MRAMKDSGVEWIGQVPLDWELSKIGAVYQERNTKVSDKDFMPLSVTKEGIVPQLETAAKTDNGENRKLICVNDFVINSRSDRRGSCGISVYNGSCSLINIVLTPRKNMDNVYYSYVFKSEPFADEFYRWGNGIVNDLWSTKWSSMKRIYIPAPGLDEQRRIASFLDAKCAQINAIIEKQQQVIEKLKAYKQSVITEAVTKGLDPTVPMKDSGVEWIGKIPEHWEVGKLGRYTSLIQTGPFGSQLHSEDYIDNGIAVINPSNIVEGEIIPDPRCSVSENTANDLSRHILEMDDIVFARRGEMGRCARIGNPMIKCICGTGCLIIRLSSQMLSKYATQYLQTTYIKQYLGLMSVGTTMSNLNAHIVSDIPILCPPQNEQAKIVEHIESTVGRINSAISMKQNTIAKLTDYKKSLIYEAVTGKMEV